MSKNSSTKTRNQRNLLLLGLVAILLVFGAVAWNSISNPTTISAPAATSQVISPADYQDLFGEGTEHLLIDVRTPEEYASGFIPNAVNIPVDELESRLDEIPSDVPVVLYCRSGNRSAVGAKILNQNGYTSVFDLGGIQDWVMEGYPIQ